MHTQGHRCLVVGAGGIGGNLAAHLTEHPATTTVVSIARNPAVVHSINDRGYVLTGAEGRRDVPGVCANTIEGAFDWVFLTTQPTNVEEAAQAALAHVAPGGAIVVLQNGLCEARVAALDPDVNIVGAIVAWGATMPEPGVFERTAQGGFTIGNYRGEADLRALQTLLEPVGPVTITDNLAGARWSKLAINCAISTLGTLGGDRLGPLMRKRKVRRLALELMTETVQVAHADGVQLQKVSGTLDLDWLAMDDGERSKGGSPSLLAKHSMLLAVGTRYRRMKSSMLRAIEAGKTPAVDYLNGEVVRHAADHGLKAPVNQRAQGLVHDIAAGKLAPGPIAVDLLFEQTAHQRIATQD